MYNLTTKAGRQQLRQAHIDNLKEKGYEEEAYKDLLFFTKDEFKYFSLIVFSGTAGKPMANYYYRSVEQRSQAIANYKANCDRREQWKAEQKEKKQTSDHAGAAKQLKEELSKLFPGIKFSVTSDSFAGGDAVRVAYVDGPREAAVDAVAGKYQYGHFDGMTDMYEYSNRRDDIPQAKYVTVSRRQSETTQAVIAAWVEKNYQDERQNLGWMIFQKTDIPAGATVTGVKRTEEQAGLLEELYTLEYEGGDNPTFEKVEVKSGEVQVIEYSAKAIAVIGDTKPIKEQLKALGGKFNFRLTCGAGWIFPKTRLQEVTEALSRKTIEQAA